MSDPLKEIAALIDGQSEEVVEEETVEAVELVSEEQDAVETEAAGEATEDQGDDIKTLGQLAEAIEVDAEYLYGIEIGMGAGQDSIPLGKLKDAYKEAVTDKQALEQQLQAQTEQLKTAQTGVSQNQALSNDMIEVKSQLAQINQQFNEVDWAEYEKQDPGAAALARQKFQEAFGQAQRQMGQLSQVQQQGRQESMREGAGKLLDAIPEWKDAEVREKERSEIKSMLMSAGYPAQAIVLEADPVATILARELIQLRAEKQTAQAAVEKVHSAPKVLKGRGKFAEKSGQKSAELKAKFKQTGKRTDELSAVKSILGM